MGAAEMKVDDILAHQMTKKLFDKLHSTRKTLKTFKSARDVGRKTKGGFLVQLVDDVYADDRREVPDLEHRSSSGLTGMLKSGIGLFGVNINKMHPRENPTVFIFVLGGISGTEIQRIRKIVTRRSAESRLEIGSTSLLSHRDLVYNFFAVNPMHNN